MHRKVLLGTFVFMLLLANFPSIALVTTTTTLYVDPPMTIVPKMGDSFAVNITVSDVTDLAGWEFKLYYNSSMLNATSITEGPFLKTGGSTYLMVIDFTDNYNASHGRIWASCVMIGTGPGVNGTGTLATISFKTKLPSVSNLHLTNTLLCNSETDPQLIPHVTINGIVNVLIHSIAVVNVTPFKTIVGRGLALRINATVINQGDSDEIFNVTAYANETIIETRTNIILTSGSSTTITLPWDTTGIPYGNYIISAYAWVAPGETDISDNTLTDGWVLVTVPGDVDGNGECNILDIKRVKLAFSGWIVEPNADMDDNGVVNILDLKKAKLICSGVARAQIYFDRSIYYPDVRVFWEPNLSVSIEIRVIDGDVNNNSVKVNVSSSIDSKEVTLTKDILEGFSGTVFAVGVGLAGGPISSASILSVRYGDEIIAEYFDISSGDNFAASALFTFPYYIMQTELHGLSNWESVSNCVFDSNGVPMIYIGGSLKYNPVTIGQYALANYYTYLNEGNLTRRERFLAQAKWFVENAKQRGNFSVWEHYFNNPAYGCTDPFVSAFAQGVGLSVLVRAYALTGNMSYIDVAEKISLAFGVEMSAGGVRYTDSDGVWFEECADEGARSGKVLNGFMFALTELYEYSFETNNSKGWTFFWEGAETLSNNIYRYDSGSWSYYDLLYHNPAALVYHKHHIAQLRTMYELTDDEIFLYYSEKFQSYIK